jgi:hypothetical protein
MKMTIFYVVISIATFLYLAEVKVSLQPLSISLPKWVGAIGWFTLVVAITLISYQRNRDGFLDGVKVGANLMAERVNQIVSEQKQKSDIDVVDPEVLSPTDATKK